MDHYFNGKKVLLGITGGIAAYKSAVLCRELVKLGADVRVVMTRGACEFITPLTLQALSGNDVHTDLLNPDAEAGMGHIELAKWPDLIVVAPATANFIAKYASGMADDLLTTLLLASSAKIFVAPAMNQAMWRHPMTQHNVSTLSSILKSSLTVIEPDQGIQACGDNGPGRLPEPEKMIEIIVQSAIAEQENRLPQDLSGKSVVITAGPTREAIDPVRYISNHSSGKMGYALAEACLLLGAKVTVVSGPCHVQKHASIHYVDVQSARDMYDKVHELINDACDIFIACAAVADYRPMNVAEQKIKKVAQDAPELMIHLEENPDIVASVANRKDKPFTVGFAAETQQVKEYARDKLTRKKLDLIVANDVSVPGQGFNSEFNQVTLITQDDEQSLELQDKQALASKIVEFMTKRFLKT